MAAYAEGLNVLAKAGHRQRADTPKDAETAPLTHPEYYRTTSTSAPITEVWRRGSVVSSWLLDLTAAALHADPQLERVRGPGQRLAARAAGRCTPRSTRACPCPRSPASLFDRFYSRDRGDVANKVLSAMRAGFGGHARGRRRTQRERRAATPRRRPGAVRRHRRPGQAQAVPGALPPGAATARSSVPVDRRGPQRLDRRGVPRSTPTTPSSPPSPTRRPRSIEPLLARLDLVQGDYADPATWTALRDALDRHHSTQRRVLHGHPADDVPDGRRSRWPRSG